MTIHDKNHPFEQPSELTISGHFEQPNGCPITGAAIHQVFLGDPPSNCGMMFDLERGQAHTDAVGQFCLTLPRLDESLAHDGPPGTWRRGCFLVLAAKDARTIGYVISTGEELANSPVRLVSLPTADVRGHVETEGGHPLAGARVEVFLYFLFVGRRPWPSAPINFWLSRPGLQPDDWPQRVTDLTASTGRDGKFVIPQVPMMPGKLRMTVSHPDCANLETDYYPYQPFMRLTFQPGAPIGIRVTLPDGRPAVGFSLNLERKPEGTNWCMPRAGMTDDMGRCEFRTLPPGSYAVRYLGDGELPWAFATLPVPGLAKGERREITVEAMQGSVIQGQVCESISGTPLHHAEVRFESEAYPGTASTYQAAYTDAEGKFAFRYPVIPGPLEITVSVCHLGKRFGQRYRIVVGSEPTTELVFRLAVPTD